MGRRGRRSRGVAAAEVTTRFRRRIRRRGRTGQLPRGDARRTVCPRSVRMSRVAARNGPLPARGLGFARALALAMLGGLLCGSSPALAAEWALTPAVPAPGETLPAAPAGAAAPQPFVFAAGAVPGFARARVTVWARDPAGMPRQDAVRVDAFDVARDGADTRIWRGQTAAPWRSEPGTYYWQASATGTVLRPRATLYTFTSALFGFSVGRPGIAGQPAAPPPSGAPAPRAPRCAELAARLTRVNRLVRRA